MNHAHHDLDRLAGYANGLDDDSDRIAAQIAGCVLCQHEYEAQVAVKNLLAQAPPVVMTSFEKANLHAALEVRLSVSSQEASPEPISIGPISIGVGRERRARRLAPLWTRISAVAAGLLVIVGVGSVWRDLPTFGAAATATTAATALAAEASPDYYAGAADVGAAPAATTAAGAPAEAQRSVLIADMASLKTETERLAQTVNADEVGAIAEAAAACPEATSDRTVLAVEEATLAGEPIIIYIVANEGGTEPIVVKSSDCTVVDLDG